MNGFGIAILPLLGVVLGAALQFWLSRASEEKTRNETLRAQAYADYLRAVALSAHLRSDEDLRDAHLNAADAKARIAVYGTVPVLEALAEFEEAGATVSDTRSRTAFVALVVAMRPAGARAVTREIEIALLGRTDAPKSLGK